MSRAIEKIPCPDPESLLQFFQGTMDELSRDSVKSHVHACGECLQVFALLASQYFASQSSSLTPQRAENQVLQAGESVGRFVVLHVVGRGGMGHVYAAYDPQLDRQVALKVLHRSGHQANQSLLEEARVIAKLNHPNIVSIYDVGTHENSGATYIAMEFVDGVSSLTHFSDRKLVPIIEYFAAVAEGLAFAHLEGVVHRDIKPANLLVGKHQRALIVDFGLSQHTSTSSNSGVEVAGTPAYMAPEQIQGLVTAQSDQYSFCVSLIQVLCGRLHSHGSAIPKELPAKLRTILTRGLQTAPADRFPDMLSLRRALVPESKGRMLLGMPAMLAAVGLAYVLWPQPSATNAPCTDSKRYVVDVWSPKIRHDISERFSVLPPFGVSLWQRTERRLEAYQSEWVKQHRDTCLATRVQQDQSEQVMNLRMECLQRRQIEFTGLVSALQIVPIEGLSKVAEAQTLLVSPNHCSTIFLSEAPLPEDDTTRERVADVQRQLAQWQARAKMGELDAAAAALQLLQIESSAIGYIALQAQVDSALAIVLSKLGQWDASEQTFMSAIERGTESFQDALVARSWMDLSWVLGYYQDHYKEAQRALSNGLAFSKRLAKPGTLPMSHSRNRGWFAQRQGNPTQAIANFHQALKLATELEHSERDVSMLHGDLGTAYLKAGDLDKAAEHVELAWRTMSTQMGEHHPDTLSLHNNYAVLLKEQDKLEEATEQFKKVLKGFRASMKSSEVYEGQVLNNLAVIYADQNKSRMAEDAYKKALSAMEIAYAGKANANVALVLHGLATVLMQTKRTAEAEALHLRSLTMKEKLLGDSHPSVAISLSGIADLYVATNRLTMAESAAQRGYDILNKRLGPDHPNTQYLQEQLGEIRGNIRGKIQSQ